MSAKKTIYNCDTCGAELVFNTNAMVKECSYCGNLLALLDNSVSNMSSKKFLPFEISEEEAYHLYKDKLFLDEFSIIEKNKVYIPFYMCNFDFCYLANCLEYVGSGDNRRIIYYDVFVDGKAIDYLFCALDMYESKLLGTEYIKKNCIKSFESLDFGDYTLLNDNLIYYEKVVDNVADLLGRSFVKDKRGNSVLITNSDCAEFNENIQMIMVPFYRFSKNDDYYYVLAQADLNKKTQSRLFSILSDIMPFLSIALLIYWFCAFVSSNMKNVVLGVILTCIYIIMYTVIGYNKKIKRDDVVFKMSKLKRRHRV